MAQRSINWRIEFYTDSRGKSDVQEYIEGLQDKERARVARCIQLLAEHGPDLSLPYAKSLKGHKPIRELIAGAHRVFYFVHIEQRCILLSAFRKKRMRTPPKHIDKAERRRVEILEREQ